ncbi:MAG: carboxypeptidase regulatory-like domain-containing protein [Flavobacterium sp.]|uniref:carboxypeptidase-like regulatory domain-containing protein n=1 Tax=Flavobacterium sp. TaxID=239 RepID=UPI001207EA66|nr:carboxypeptidase-like regulatory domain-containing protein [Flavobacterium sp.]RZJ67924.1 MAG: carboxypeptidase regulatory-like domain-containing protein [Flavobacterium sp.]
MSKMLLYFVLFPTLIAAQIKGRVIDEHGDPIAYVNIFPESGNDGFSAEADGTFSIPNHKPDEKFTFSAVGFKTITLQGIDVNEVVMWDETVKLREIVVGKAKRKRSKQIDKFGTSGIRVYINQTAGKVFNPDEKSEYPFLTEVTFNSKSEISGAKVNIRIMSVNENGEPDLDLVAKNIIASVPKGDRKTTVNIAEFNIEIPQNGIFVAIEPLKIKENLYTTVVVYESISGDKKTREVSVQQPYFGFLPSDENNTWYLTSKWSKRSRHKVDDSGSLSNVMMRKYHDKFLESTISITISN